MGPPVRDDLSTGLPGVGEVRPGTHVCAFYSGPAERDRLLVSYLQEGLRRGDRCECLIDDLEPGRLRQRAHGTVGPGDTRRRGRLGVHPAPDTDLRVGLSVDRVVSLLVTDPPRAADGEQPLLRVAGEMSRVRYRQGATGLSGYESVVMGVLAELPAVFLCLHDLERFQVDMLVDVLRIHSTVLLGGSVLHNSHCLEPADWPRPAPAGASRHPLTHLRAAGGDGGDLWLTLTGAEVRLAELVAQGLTNRASAGELLVSPHTVDAHLKHIYLKLGIHSRVELTVLALRHGRPAS